MFRFDCGCFLIRKKGFDWDVFNFHSRPYLTEHVIWGAGGDDAQWLKERYRPFAACHTRGTKPPCWDAKFALGQDQQKAYIILNGNFLCLSCPSATFAPRLGGFVPREWQAAKGLFGLNNDKYSVVASLLSMKRQNELTTTFCCSCQYFRLLLLLLGYCFCNTLSIKWAYLLIDWFDLSSRPFDCGWYDDVILCWTPKDFISCSHTCSKDTHLRKLWKCWWTI